MHVDVSLGKTQQLDLVDRFSEYPTQKGTEVFDGMST